MDKKPNLPKHVLNILKYSKSFIIPTSKQELLDLCFIKKSTSHVSYVLPKWLIANGQIIRNRSHKSHNTTLNAYNQDDCDCENNFNHASSHCTNKKNLITEAWVVKCKNGLAVNFCQDYMRKRDGSCLYVADELPTDKPRFKESFGINFDTVKSDTYKWLKKQDLLVVPFYIIDPSCKGLLIAPKNASFFAYALTLLQSFLPLNNLEDIYNFNPDTIIYLAPPLRHTHFSGRQIVVHNRTNQCYELYSYNLYPGPSAKKGIYGYLLDSGLKKDSLVLHASCVKLTTPYDNQLTILHEGASGSGKSEMCEPLHRQQDGKILIATNSITNALHYLTITETSNIDIVGDDMMIAKIDDKTSNLIVKDGENGWFLRVDNATEYGTQPQLEQLSINPKTPLCFFNIDCVPHSTCLLWQHSLDLDGTKNKNPRVIIPRSDFNNVHKCDIKVDVRSFGIRTAKSTDEIPNYGIIGALHILPPALAWVWRLLSPRGHNNPSINDSTSKSLVSEGIGSFWPFASGVHTDYTNLMLKQLMKSKNILYVLIPNQYIGCYKVDFNIQYIVREYIARMGGKFRQEQLQASRLPLLGYQAKSIKINGQYIPNCLLNPQEQLELGIQGYDKCATLLQEFATNHLKTFDIKNILPLGQKIIKLVIDNAPLNEYENLELN